MLIRTVVTTFNTQRCHRPFHRRSFHHRSEHNSPVKLHQSKIHNDAHPICVSQRNPPFKSTLLRLRWFIPLQLFCMKIQLCRHNYAGQMLKTSNNGSLGPKCREMSQTLTHGMNSQHPQIPTHLAFLHFSRKVWAWPDRCETPLWCRTCSSIKIESHHTICNFIYGCRS